MPVGVAAKTSGAAFVLAAAVAVVLAAAVAVVLVFHAPNSSTSGGSEADYRKAVMAAPTAAPKDEVDTKKLDDHREHTIVLQVSYVPRNVGDRTLKGFKAAGYHSVPAMGHDSSLRLASNVAMVQTTIAVDPEQRWRSKPFQAREGDVVKAAIDARGRFAVTCSISQDGFPVAHAQVDAGRNVADAKVGIVACTWRVQPVG